MIPFNVWFNDANGARIGEWTAESAQLPRIGETLLFSGAAEDDTLPSERWHVVSVLHAWNRKAEGTFRPEVCPHVIVQPLPPPLVDVPDGILV